MRFDSLGNICTTVTDYVANGSFKALKENVSHKNAQDGYAILIRLTDYRNKFKGPFEYIDRHGYNFLSKTKLYGNEIIISNVGAHLGTVFRTPTLGSPMSLGPNAILLKTKYIDDYYYYFFTSKKGQALLKTIVSGSAQPKFNKTDLKKLIVPVPSLDEQNKISRKLLAIDKKIQINEQINANLTNQLNSMFDKMYYESSLRIELMNFVSEMKSGDWGKAKLTDNFIKPAVIIRGTDFCNVANGQKSDAPIRYLKTATIQKKHLIANDVLIEISGGSPTQSTGRSLLITDKLLNRYNTPVLGTNFTRLFRCETEENAVLFHSYINFLYNKNVFFNYENGTTGIKNLDYKSILKINVNDVQKHSLFPKYFSMYHFYESMKQHLGDESTVLTCLKEQLLRKFF